MDKNKSIDGLVSRRTKTNNSKNSTKVASATKTKSTTKKTTTKKIVVDSPKKTKPTQESIAEDFLSQGLPVPQAQGDEKLPGEKREKEKRTGRTDKPDTGTRGKHH